MGECLLTNLPIYLAYKKLCALDQNLCHQMPCIEIRACQEILGKVVTTSLLVEHTPIIIHRPHNRILITAVTTAL